MTPYQKHAADWKDCERCPLCVKRRRVVLYRGSIPADILFVGEAPGESEDVIGRPFVGPAGKFLDRAIAAAWSEVDQHALNAQHLFAMCWGNLVACIPKDADSPSTRKRGEPLPNEIAACAPRLEEFFKICKPKLIVAVGQLSEKESKTKRWDAIAKVASVVHPAAILRMDVSQRGLAEQRLVQNLSDAFLDLVENP